MHLCSGGKYWRIWQIDCHSPIFYPPILTYLPFSVLTSKSKFAKYVFPHQSLEISLFFNIPPLYNFTIRYVVRSKALWIYNYATYIVHVHLCIKCMFIYYIATILASMYITITGILVLQSATNLMYHSYLPYGRKHWRIGLSPRISGEIFGEFGFNS